MAGESAKPKSGSAPKGDGGALSEATSGRRRLLRSAWPLPALVLGVGLLAGGLTVAILTRPKTAVVLPLDHAKELAKAGELQAALDVLNNEALPLLAHGEPGSAEAKSEADFRLTRARVLFDAQAEAHLSREENHEAVLEDYKAAERLGATLTEADLGRAAESLIALGKTKEAASRVEQLPKSARDRRRTLLRSIVERNLKMPDLQLDFSLGLLADLAQDVDQPASEAAWTIARQTELLLRSGHGAEAVSKALREMQRLVNLPPRDEGELRYMLARAYIETGDLARAHAELARATELVDSSDSLQARIGVAAGRLAQAMGQIDEAREKFTAVVSRFSAEHEAVEAIYGLASVEAALGNDDAAIDNFRALRGKVGEPGSAISAEMVSDDLGARCEARLEAGKLRESLRYADAAEELLGAAKMSPEMLLVAATAHRRLADDLLGRGEDAAGTRRSAVDRATREEAKRHYLDAASYFERHASAVVVRDPTPALESQWAAALCFDDAGEIDDTIRVLSSFLQGVSDDSSRRPEAKFRMAQAFQAKADYDASAALYRELIVARGADKGMSKSLQWSDRSVVPLAQCLLSDKDASNDSEAEESLVALLSGRDLTPDAPEYPQALRELGRYYYMAQRYPQAITRLTEALNRYPTDAEAVTTRFRLADSLRLSAAQIAQTLREAMPQSQREDLVGLRAERLTQARSLFELVRDELSGRDASALNDLDRIHLRNASFSIGDCAYELRDYDGAIRAYDAARQRYAEDPASLVAMVQIVSAYVEQREWEKAQTANERARQHLARFPDSVWETPNLPMEKHHWERWLDSRTLLQQRAAAEHEDPP